MNKRDREILARYMGMAGIPTREAGEGDYVAECARELQRQLAWEKTHATDVCQLIWDQFAPKDEERLDELLVEEGVRGKARHLKAAQLWDYNGRFEAVAVPYEMRAVGGAYFNEDSRLHYGPDVPVLFYEHGRRSPGVEVGRTIKTASSPIGEWMRAQLQVRSEYEALLRDLMSKGLLLLEPGLAKVQFAGDGRVTRAVIPEVSLIKDRVALGAALSNGDLTRMMRTAPYIKGLVGRL